MGKASRKRRRRVVDRKIRSDQTRPVSVSSRAPPVVRSVSWSRPWNPPERLGLKSNWRSRGLTGAGQGLERGERGTETGPNEPSWSRDRRLCGWHVVHGGLISLFTVHPFLFSSLISLFSGSAHGSSTRATPASTPFFPPPPAAASPS